MCFAINDRLCLPSYNFKENDTRICATVAGMRQSCKCRFGHGLGSDLVLEQAGAAAWENLVEEFQGIVIVENLDGQPKPRVPRPAFSGMLLTPSSCSRN